MRRTPFNAFIKSQLKRRLRNKRFLIWVIIMPMLFMGSLYLIWGGEGVQPHVAVLNQDGSSISQIAMGVLRTQDNLNVEEVYSLDEGVEKLRWGEAEIFLVIPDDFSEKWENISRGEEEYESIIFDIYYTAGEQEEELINMILKGVVEDINTFIEGDRQRPVEIKTRKLTLNGGSTMDMLLPSGIIIVIVHIGIYASSSDTSRLRELKFDKRLKTSSWKSIYVVSGKISVDSSLTTSAGLIALLSGSMLFEISISSTIILGSVLLFFITSLVFNLIGHIIGKFSDTQTSSQSISSMFVFPFIFFAQAYLFSSFFPEYIRMISRFLPIYPLVDGMRKLLFYPISIVDYGIIILISLIWLGFTFSICFILENRR